ncbi:CopM family metallochaperone [Novosphingobium sp.]|uniref:CopM family metallochaperone n=1 Tax=Novosphingobium sp. TaxID=1874826 RepID=UPI003BAC0BBD
MRSIEGHPERSKVMRGQTIAVAAALIALVLVLGKSAAWGDPVPRDYGHDIDAAMERMHKDMMAPRSGDVDRDFVQAMVPHHQGAIDMAVAELRYGRNPQLKRIAQEIIIDQQQEIAAMRLALGQPLPPSAPAPTQPDAKAQRGN